MDNSEENMEPLHIINLLVLRIQRRIFISRISVQQNEHTTEQTQHPGNHLQTFDADEQ